MIKAIAKLKKKEQKKKWPDFPIQIIVFNDNIFIIVINNTCWAFIEY